MRALALTLALVLSTSVRAQSPGFDVATIKPSSRSSSPIGVFVYPGGRLVLNQLTVRMVILQAFQLQEYQLAGGPAWINSARFDIVAQPPEASASRSFNPTSIKERPTAEQNQMLQSLLKERFKLKLSSTASMQQIYRLERALPAKRLVPTQHADSAAWCGGVERQGAISGTGIAGINISMQGLSTCLGRYLGKVVIDATDLIGNFDFTSDVRDDADLDVPSSLVPSLKTIGLTLKPARGLVDVLTIENIEQPSAN